MSETIQITGNLTAEPELHYTKALAQ